MHAYHCLMRVFIAENCEVPTKWPEPLWQFIGSTAFLHEQLRGWSKSMKWQQLWHGTGYTLIQLSRDVNSSGIYALSNDTSIAHWRSITIVSLSNKSSIGQDAHTNDRRPEVSSYIFAYPWKWRKVLAPSLSLEYFWHDVHTHLKHTWDRLT